MVGGTARRQVLQSKQWSQLVVTWRRHLQQAERGLAAEDVRSTCLRPTMLQGLRQVSGIASMSASTKVPLLPCLVWLTPHPHGLAVWPIKPLPL